MKVKRKVKPDKTLYEIDIFDIDKAQNKIKIHYKGYGSELDEWRSCVELGIAIRLEKFRLLVPLKTDTTHFTIASTER